MENILSLKSVTKEYKDFTLDHVTFDIPKGVVLGMIGENGAGKSTCISAILDMVKLNDGHISIFDEDHHTAGKAIREKIGTVIDGINQMPYFHCKDIDTVYGKIYRHWNSEQFFAYLQKFRLPTTKPVKDFSKGMNVKLNFAIALSHGAELLLLDEATSGLDPVMRDEILELLQEFMLDEGHSVLISSHITSDLDKIADYLLFIHKGQVRFLKSMEEIQNCYGVLTCGQELFSSIAEQDYDAYIKETFSYRLLINNRAELLRHIHGLTIEKATIEDIMLFYIKGVLTCQD